MTTLAEDLSYSGIKMVMHVTLNATFIHRSQIGQGQILPPPPPLKYYSAKKTYFERIFIQQSNANDVLHPVTSCSRCCQFSVTQSPEPPLSESPKTPLTRASYCKGPSRIGTQILISPILFLRPPASASGFDIIL